VGIVPVGARATADGLVPVMRPARRAIVIVAAGSALTGISSWNLSTGSQTTVPACLRASWMSTGDRLRGRPLRQPPPELHAQQPDASSSG